MKPIKFLFPVLLGLPHLSQSADITWQTPQAISSSSDVSTNGALVLAKQVTHTTYGGYANQTVNGVTFLGDQNTQNGVTFGIPSGFSGADQTSYVVGAAGTPGTLSTEYQRMLTGGYYGGAGTATVTLSGLTLGQQYELQFWVADYRQFPPNTYARSLTLTAGNTSGALTYLHTNGSGLNLGSASGSYILGTFTADNSTQSITINAGDSVQINALQLRAIITDADGIWTGTDGNWSDATKWQSNTIAQGVDKSATFNGLTPVSATMDVARPLGALFFSGSNHTIAAGSGSLTLDGGATYATPTIDVASGITATIGALLSGNEGLAKTGTGTLTLSGANTYTGVTTINAGILDFNAAVNFNGSATTFGGAGTLRKTGAGEVSWGAAAVTFNLGSGALIDVQGGTFTGGSFGNEVWTGNLSDLNVAAGATFAGVEANVRVNKITGSGTITTGYPNGYTGFTIGVDDGSSTFDGVIADSSFSAAKLIKVGTGTITLTGASTYTGTTTVEAGALSLTQAFLNNDAGVVIGFDGKLNLGFAGTDVVGSIKIDGTELTPGVYNSSHPTYGSYFTGTGSLEILGGNGTWTSLSNGDWSVAGNWSGGTVASGIDSIATFNAATGVTVNLDSSRTIGGLTFGTTGYTLAGSSTLTLNTTADISTLTVDPGLAATISAKLASAEEVKKSGTGTLTLSAQNNFSSAITVSQGALELANAWTLGNVGTGTPIVPGLVTVESGATLRAVSAPANQLNGLTLNSGTVEAVGVGNADWGNFHLTGNVTATGTSNLNAEVALRTANVDFFVDSGSTLNVGGVMHNGAYYGIYSGAPANVSKSGDGTMVLSAANTYTGSTTVDAGALNVTNTGGLRFIPTTNGITNSVTTNGFGTLSFLGTVSLDLGSAAAAGGNSWNLFNLGSYTGLTPGAVTSTLGSFSEGPVGTWKLPVTGAEWVFTEADGNLAYVITANDYDTWKTANGVTGGKNDDDDSDGLTNFEEYAFGLDPTGSSEVNPIVVPLDKATGKFRYTRRATPTTTGLTYTVWTSTDLATWTEDAGATLSQSVTGTVGEVETVEATLTGGLQLAQPKLFIQVRAQ